MTENNDKEKAAGRGEKKGGISRRKWLIDVGKTAALAGIAGKAGPLEASASPAPAHSESGSEALPPGLYRPSYDHLTHALESESRFHPIPPGCPVDFVQPRSGPFEPQFFSREEYQVVHRLTALLLGESPASSGQSKSAPGGSVTDEVAQWIDLHVYSFASVREAAERLTPEQVALAEAYDGARDLHRIKTLDVQKSYRDGLAWIAEESARRHQRGFVELSETQQIVILDAISDGRPAGRVENDGTRFFRRLKGDIISGFYTSRTGLKELDYKGNRFYVESPGCTWPDGHPPETHE